MKRLITSLPINLNQRRVVVTGIGTVSPLGQTFQETWKHLSSTTPANDGDYGITSLEKALVIQDLPEDVFNHDVKLGKLLPSQVAAPVRGVPFDPRTSRFVQFALIATAEAVQVSGLKDWLGLSSSPPESNDKENVETNDVIQYRRTRAGTCIASGMSSIREVVEAHEVITNKSSIRRLNPHFVPKILCNAPSSRVSLEYHLEGPNLAPSTACAAGAHAIGEAMRCIQYHDADIMIAGGAESCIDPVSMGGFCRLKALSTKYNEDPLIASRPFDLGRDGFVMGEGSAILILEEMEHAKDRGANILCELRGYGLSGDAYHVTSPDPNGRGAERAMKMALARAGIPAGHVDYVNAHATSTPMGDEIEEKTIDRVLCDEAMRTNDLYVSSTKGATGHLLGAAGAFEAAVAVNTIVHGIVPPTKNLTGMTKNGRNSFFNHVLESPLDRYVNVAVSNSFGFGGTNACLVFSRIID
mmetsp:Transcript_15516/g.29270  ORF Transcript_15516/g.29270 Transcript_15516/m.29270 type:complete len:470 (-) Transcript_15516:141-1550(-)|eukprot:CAMPEP_0176497860 /NCGR_PEP_ID=MMETSP0200_2-20121128/11978_1 /TAXON_ID=947934 /ORGANISM="Chaetoceros sp., Strain GSL56" /LENGTH=469 /DNA_ID=CAMNT_0017895959 /DNA_START=100 /DNA_END=1509 /DNA_ORIENTATION=-